MPAGLQLNQLLHEPEALAGLIKGGCPVLRHPRAVGRDLRKLLLPHRIRAGSRLPLRQLRVPAGIPDHGLAAYDGRLQKLALGAVIPVPGIAFIQFRLHFPDQPTVAHGQHLIILHRHMPHAVVEIIPRGENIVLHGLLRLLGHEGGGKLAGGLPLPVGVRLQQLLPGLLRYVERIRLSGGDGLELRLQPFIGKFRISLAAPGSDGAAAHYKLVLPDDDGDIVQNMLEGQGPPHDNGLILRGLIRFRDQLRPGGLDLRHLRIEMRHQPWDALRFGDFLCIIFCHCCSFPYSPLFCSLLLFSPVYRFTLLFTVYRFTLICFSDPNPDKPEPIFCQNAQDFVVKRLTAFLSIPADKFPPVRLGALFPMQLTSSGCALKVPPQIIPAFHV